MEAEALYLVVVEQLERLVLVVEALVEITQTELMEQIILAVEVVEQEVKLVMVDQV